MAETDNNPKTIPDKGQIDNKAVTNKPVDINAPLSLDEANAIMEAPEGEIEQAIEKTKFDKDKEIAPDLVKLKAEQDRAKQEIKEKKAEVVEAEKTAPVEPAEIPDKFKNKTTEEVIKLSRETEAYNTKLSQKNKELEAKLADLKDIDKKIEQMEKDSVIRQQKATSVKLPEYPSDDLFYEDPKEYHKKIKEYNDARLNAMITPLYGQNWNTQKADAIKKLEKDTKDDIIPYADVENEVKDRLRRNPALVNQYGINASKVAYDQIKNERLPTKIEEIRAAAKEEAKRELEEDNKQLSDSQIMSSDITTKARESKPVDYTEMLDKTDDPEKVIQGLKKKYKISRDI